MQVLDREQFFHEVLELVDFIRFTNALLTTY